MWSIVFDHMFDHVLNLQAFSNSQCQSRAFKWPRLAETNSGVAPDRVREFMQAPDSMRTWTASKWPFSAAICLKGWICAPPKASQKAISGHKMHHPNTHTHNPITGFCLNRHKKMQNKNKAMATGPAILEQATEVCTCVHLPFLCQHQLLWVPELQSHTHWLQPWRVEFPAVRL